MKSMIPTLTTDGYVTNKNIIMRKLWEYFVTSEYSQSNTFYAKVSSLKWLIASHKVSSELSRSVEDSLVALYKRYFDNVECDATIESVNNTGMYKLKIGLRAVDGEKTYHLAQELEYSNGKLDKYETLLDELYESYAPQDTYV